MTPKKWIGLLFLLILSKTCTCQTLIAIKDCCRYKTVMDEYSWFKCPLNGTDIGDNMAIRFCQTECIANFLGFSNGTNLDFSKVNKMISNLPEPEGAALSLRTVENCKKVVNVKMKQKIETAVFESKCSAEFSFFVCCLALEMHYSCPDSHKIQTDDCQYQLSSFKPLMDNLQTIIKADAV